MTENVIFFHFFNIQETLILLSHSGIQEVSTENKKSNSNNNNKNNNNNNNNTNYNNNKPPTTIGPTSTSHKEKALALFFMCLL